MSQEFTKFNKIFHNLKDTNYNDNTNTQVYSPNNSLSSNIKNDYESANSKNDYDSSNSNNNNQSTNSKNDYESANSKNNNEESENISITDSSSCEEDLHIMEYEKKYKLKFKINKKSVYEELKDFNTDNLQKIEEEVIRNNYEYILNNISNKNRDKLLCNGKCFNKHTFNNILENFKNNKSFKTKDKCYKNNLYYALKNNIRGIKTIYNLLLRLIVIYPKYRNKCKCCIIETDKELLKNFEIDFRKNEKKINNQTILYINFLINKFLGIISLLPCECKFDKLQTYYTLNYCNYNEYFEIYIKTIPTIIELLKVNHNIKNEKYELSLIKSEKCIHEDIRYYNKFEYCKYNKYEKELTDDFNINYIIINLEIINEWLKNNFRICNLLFNEQNLIFYKYFIKNYDEDNYNNSLVVKIDDINNILGRLYKNTNIIDINYTSNEENLVQIILNNNVDKIANNIIKFVINKLKEINKINKLYDINNYLLFYTCHSIKYKKYSYGLEFIENIQNIVDNKIYYNMIEYIINEIIINKEIEINDKISYFKIINKNKINIINIKILDKLIEVYDGDLILSKFEKTNNIFIFSFSSIEEILYIIKKCIIYRKSVILDYLLYNLDDNIKNINKKNNNIINPYQILFLNKENDKSEIIYLDFLEVINKYKYNINEDFKKNDNDKFTYLNLCIKKNYIELGIRLINHNIILNNIIQNKAIIFYCIDYKNHFIANTILQKNKELGNIFYNGKNIINYLFEKKEEELNENIKIKFLLIFFKNNFLNFDYQDKINQNIGFLILKSNFNKLNKIILFKIISNHIDPLLKNDKIPLIIYSMLLDEFEITYMLMNKLIDSKKILKTMNDGIFSYYLNNNEEINYIPIILKFIKDYDRNKILDSNIELNIITEQNKCENILVMYLKIICYFLKNINNTQNNLKFFITESNTSNKTNYNNKNNYIKSNKNIVKINYKKSKLYYKKQEEINQYIELPNDDNDVILETDTMQNSNIWKTTTLDTDSESSEIEVSG